MFSLQKNDLTNQLKALDHTVSPSDEPFPMENHFIHIISGAKGTGKSTLFLNILDTIMRKKYDNIFLVSPTARTDMKFKKLVDELDQDDKVYEEFNEKNLESIMKRIKDFNKGKKKPKNLIVFDDCISEMKGSFSKSLFNKMATTNRHMKTCIVVMTQKYNKLPTILRANADLFTIFPTANRSEFNAIMSDMNEDEDLFKQIYQFATDGDRCFLHVSNLGGKMRYFKCFDRIVLN